MPFARIIFQIEMETETNKTIGDFTQQSSFIGARKSVHWILQKYGNNGATLLAHCREKRSVCSSNIMRSEERDLFEILRTQ